MPLGTLSSFDLVLIFLYFALLLYIGFRSSRGQNEEDYLMAGRKLGTWRSMMTINASKSGSILMVFVALVYLWGFSAIWYFIGVVMGAILFIPFAMKLRKKSKDKYYTLADYFKHNYGRRVSSIVSALTILLMFGFLVLNLMAGTKLFVFFSGWPFWICASVMVAVVLLYILMAGFSAVAKTDIFQYIAMMAILVLLALLLFNGSLIPTSEWDIWRADAVTIIGFFVVGIMFAFGSPDLWQRVYSAKGKKELRNGLILSVIIYAIMAFLLSLIALTVKVNFPSVDPDLALIHGFANLLPSGLLGLSVILLFAAIMSSVDTYIFTAASATVQDFFDWDKKKTILWIRVTVLILAILTTLISIIIQDLVIGSYIFVSFVVIIAISALASWIYPEVKKKTLLFSLIFGILGLVGFLLMSLINREIKETVVIVALGSSVLGLVIGWIVGLVKRWASY